MSNRFGLPVASSASDQSEARAFFSPRKRKRAPLMTTILRGPRYGSPAASSQVRTQVPCSLSRSPAPLWRLGNGAGANASDNRAVASRAVLPGMAKLRARADADSRANAVPPTRAQHPTGRPVAAEGAAGLARPRART